MAPLLFPSALGESSTADFEFMSAVFGGDWSARGPGQQALIFIPPSDADNRFAWALEAAEVQLTWSRTSRYEFSRPNDSSTFTYAEKEPPRQWNESTTAQAAISQSRSAESNLVVVGWAAHAPQAEVTAADVSVGRQEDAWHAGSDTGAELSGNSSINTRVAYRLPADHLQVEVRNATLRVSGDLSIAVWDADVKLNESGSWRTVQPGRTSSEVAPNVREADYRLLWIHAKNATLFLELHDGLARLAAPFYGFDGQGVASFQGSKGLATDATGTYALDRHPVRAEGDLAAAMRRAPSGGVHADLQVRDGRVEFADATLTATSVPAAPAPANWAWAWAAAALLPLVWMGVRRLRPVTIDEVEWAILAGHERRGLRLAKRLVGKTPTDPNAVFLYGTTLLARGRLEALVKTIEPLSLKIKPRDRRGIAFVLAVAAHGSNDVWRARRWAAEAAEDPQLRDQLEKNGVLAVAPSLVQSAYA